MICSTVKELRILFFNLKKKTVVPCPCNNCLNMCLVASDITCKTRRSQCGRFAGTYCSIGIL